MKIFQARFLLLTLLSYDQLFSPVFSIRGNALERFATTDNTDKVASDASSTTTTTITPPPPPITTTTTTRTTTTTTTTTTTMSSPGKDASEKPSHENPYTLPPDSTSGNPLSKIAARSPTDELNLPGVASNHSSIDQTTTATTGQTWQTGSTGGYLNTSGDAQPRFENETLLPDGIVTDGVLNNQGTEKISTTTTGHLHSDSSHRSHRKRYFNLAIILLTLSLVSVVCNTFNIIVHCKKSPALASLLVMLCATDIVQGISTIAIQVLDFFLAKKFSENVGSLGVGLKLRVALGRGLNAFLDRSSQVLSALICMDRFLVLSSTIGLESWIQVHSKAAIGATYTFVFVLVVTDGYIMYVQLSNKDDSIEPSGQRTNGTLKEKLSGVGIFDEEIYFTTEAPQAGSQRTDVVSEVSESSAGHGMTTIFEHHGGNAATTMNSITSIGVNNRSEQLNGERHSCNKTVRGKSSFGCRKHGSESTTFDPTAIKVDDDMTRTKTTSTLIEEPFQTPDLSLAYSNSTDIPMEGTTSLRAESNASSARSDTHETILQTVDIAINGIMLIIFVVMIVFTIATVVLLKGRNRERDKLGCGGRRKRRQSVIIVTMTTVYVILALPTTTVTVVKDLKVWPEFDIEGDWRDLFVLVITIGTICDQLKNASDFFVFVFMSRSFRMSLKVSLCRGECKSEDIYSVSRP